MPALRRGVAPVGLFRPRLLNGALAAAAAAVAIAALTAAVATTAAPGPAPGPVTVRFAEPASTTLLQGPTRITIEAATSPDAHIVSVTLFADDALLTTMEHAPFTVTWDAGRAAGVRRLRAAKRS